MVRSYTLRKLMRRRMLNHGIARNGHAEARCPGPRGASEREREQHQEGGRSPIPHQSPDRRACHELPPQLRDGMMPCRALPSCNVSSGWSVACGWPCPRSPPVPARIGVLADGSSSAYRMRAAAGTFLVEDALLPPPAGVWRPRRVTAGAGRSPA